MRWRLTSLTRNRAQWEPTEHRARACVCPVVFASDRARPNSKEHGAFERGLGRDISLCAVEVGVCKRTKEEILLHRIIKAHESAPRHFPTPAALLYQPGCFPCFARLEAIAPGFEARQALFKHRGGAVYRASRGYRARVWRCSLCAHSRSDVVTTAVHI